MEDFAVLMLMGIRVRRVFNLKEGAVFAKNAGVLFVDDQMSHDDRELICRQVLSRIEE